MAIFGSEKYDFFRFNGEKPVVFPYRGSKSLVLNPGRKFGTRAATSAKATIRLVIEDEGISRVITVDADKVFELVQKSNRAH